MEFGLFHEFQQAPGEGPARAFAQSFEQVDAAERMGLDAMWLAELHFNPERSVLSSPLVLQARPRAHGILAARDRAFLPSAGGGRHLAE